MASPGTVEVFRGWMPAAGVVGLGLIGLRLVEAGGRLDGVIPAGSEALTGEVARWLPWQIADNLAGGRAPWDASVFSEAPGSLWSVVGNPGALALIAPVHAAFAPGVAISVGALIAGVLNVVGAAIYGASRRAALAGALAGAAASWFPMIAAGHLPQAFVFPAAMAAAFLAAAGGGTRRVGWAFCAAGAVVAPLPSAALLLGAGEPLAAGFAALGLLFPAWGTWGGPALAAEDLVWIGGRGAHVLPLALSLVAVALFRRGGGARGVSLLILGALAGALTPVAVGGYRLSLPAFLPAPEGVGAACALGLGAGVPLVAGLRTQSRWLLAAFLAVDAAGPVWTGGARGWEPRPETPALFTGLASAPRRGRVQVVPEGDTPGAGVAWVAVHRQFAAREPGLAAGGVTPEKVATRLRSKEGPLTLVLVGSDAATRSRWASTLGKPVETTSRFAVWHWP